MILRNIFKSTVKPGDMYKPAKAKKIKVPTGLSPYGGLYHLINTNDNNNAGTGGGDGGDGGGGE
jgi:hypothetical protein